MSEQAIILHGSPVEGCEHGVNLYRFYNNEYIRNGVVYPVWVAADSAEVSEQMLSGYLQLAYPDEGAITHGPAEELALFSGLYGLLVDFRRLEGFRIWFDEAMVYKADMPFVRFPEVSQE